MTKFRIWLAQKIFILRLKVDSCAFAAEDKAGLWLIEQKRVKIRMAMRRFYFRIMRICARVARMLDSIERRVYRGGIYD